VRWCERDMLYFASLGGVIECLRMIVFVGCGSIASVLRRRENRGLYRDSLGCSRLVPIFIVHNMCV
jgi:hypothetical protein